METERPPTASATGTPSRSVALNGMDLSTRARTYAVQKHGGQTRKYSDEPYVTHLDAVVRLLKEHAIEDENVLAAAYLHDVVEDTPVTMQEVIDEFGDDVARLVYWLTDDEKGNRKSRMKMATWRLAQAPWNAKLIKLADIVDNTRSISEADPNFGPVFLREKRAVLYEMAEVEGDRITNHQLYQQAAAQVMADAASPAARAG